MELKRIENDVKESEPSKNAETIRQHTFFKRDLRDKLEQKGSIENGNVEKIESADKKPREVEEKTNNPRNEHCKQLEKKSEIDNPKQAEKFEKEINSPFSRENFKPENSYDAKAKLEHPELNELKSKCVYDVASMGDNMKTIDRTPKGEYTKEEREKLKEIRDKIDAPTTETLMQKVIGVASGTDEESIKKDLAAYFEPYNKYNGSIDMQVFGCVSKAEDAAPFTKTPQECHDNLRLDYPRTNYTSPENSVYVIRFKDGENYEIPYSKEFCGTYKMDQPFTGNGFTASDKISVPEFAVKVDKDKNGAIVTDGEIYRINPDGTEDKVAYFNKKHHCFKIYEKEV